MYRLYKGTCHDSPSFTMMTHLCGEKYSNHYITNYVDDTTVEHLIKDSNDRDYRRR